MPNFFDQFDNEDRVTPEDRTNPVNAGLNDEDILAAKRPAGNFFDQFDDPNAAPPAPEVVPDSRGTIKTLWDAIIRGYHQSRATENTYDAAADFQQTERIRADKMAGHGLPGLRLAPIPESTKHIHAEGMRKDAESELASAAEQNALAAERPLSQEARDFLNENSGVPVWEAFKKAPLKIIAEIGLQSAPASAASIAGGVAGGLVGGRAGFAVGSGATSGRIEYASSIVDGLREHGIDVTNADALANAVADPELMDAVETKAMKRAAIIGGVDAIAGLVGATNLAPNISRAFARELSNIAIQAPLQAGLGGAGELGAQLATREPGEALDSRAVAAEMAGELVTTPVEVGAAALSGAREKAGGDKGPLEELDAVQTAQQKARADVAARGGDKLDQEVAAALAGAEASSYKRGAHEETTRAVREAQRILKVEEDYALGTAQSEEDATRAQIQAEAAARYEAGQPAPAADPLEVVKSTPAVRAGVFETPDSAKLTAPPKPDLVKEDAFARAEREAAAKKESEVAAAEVQRNQQVATESARSEPLRTPIGEAPRTLRERRAQLSVKPAKAAQPTAGAAPEPSAMTEDAAQPAAIRNPDPPPAALPPPKTARIEVDTAGTARKVSEAELENRETAQRKTLTLAQRRTENAPRAPVIEAAPRTLTERREAITAANTSQVEAIDRAAHEAAPSPKNDLAEPSEAQREAGNYKKGHVKVHGMDISIENPRGSLRKFRNPDGVEGQRRMRDHYGYIRRTEGADGDHVDVFLGDRPDSSRVFVIDQVKPDGTFDEHKAMVGYATREDAVRAYSRNYQSGWRVGPVTEMSVDEFKKWAKEGDTKSPLKPDELRMRRTLAMRRPKKDTGSRLAEGDAHLAEKNGLVMASTEHGQGRAGAISAKVDKDRGVLQIGVSSVPQNLQGQGRGIKMMEALAARAQKDGLKLVSDTRVSEQAQQLYKALERRGYTVKQNPATRQASGELVSNSELKPVFEVTPPVRLAEASARDAAQLPGFETQERLPGKIWTVRANGLPIGEVTANADGSFSADGIVDNRKHFLPQMQKISVKDLGTFSSREAAEKAIRRNALTQRTPLGESRATIAQVNTALKPLLDEIGRDGVAVVAHPRELPAADRTRLAAQFGERRLNAARGLYDPVTDTVHIFAENHRTAEDALSTTIHEVVAHRGLRRLLGSKHGPLMLDVFENASDKTWMRDFADQHDIDTGDLANKALVADEYIASIAERGTDLTLLEKVIAAVRAVLRKLGVVDAWTETDIKRLLQKSRTFLREKRASKGATVSPYGARLADGDPTQPTTPNNHPQQRLWKMNVTAEEQANYNPGFVRSRLDAIEDKALSPTAIDGVLALVPLANLSDFMAPGAMPSTQAYVRENRRMDGRKSELLQASEAVADRWLKFVRKNKDAARVLGELMHAATLAGVDPANKYRPKHAAPKNMEQRRTEDERRQQHALLKKFWDALPEDAKRLYIDVRDAYSNQRDLVQQALEQRIMEAQANDNTKQELINSLRQKFESGRVAGPYFPLARFGDEWAVAKDAKGNTVSFARFENTSEQRAWIAEMKKSGYQVDSGTKMNVIQVAKRIDPGFVAKIAAMLDEIDPEMADDVWQQYLRNLPEMSMRRHYIHRKGRLGFTADALRAFAFLQFHGAHQIAKLEHFPRMDAALKQMEVDAGKFSKEDGSSNQKWAAGLVREYTKRHEWIRNPETSLLSTQLTSLGFAFYLGMSPAAALVNLTQTPIVAYPTLAARFGWAASGAEILKASALWAGTNISRAATGKKAPPMSQRLRGDEQKAFNEASEAGLFDKSMAHTLAGLGEDGAFDYGSKRQRISAVISYMFHKTEEGNRQVTFLAAYRLARKKGRSHDDAVVEAENLTWDSHFDYANANRPRIMQGNTAKVLFLFRQYSVNMTYRLTRDFKDSIGNEIANATRTLAGRQKVKIEKQVKRAAYNRFAGILGQTMLFAGASGLPLFWAVKVICDSLFGDDDEPFDTEAAMRVALYEQGGEAWSSAVMDGPMSMLTRADLSSRVGLNNLWLRDPPAGSDAKESATHYLKEIAGPLPSMVINAAESLDLHASGQDDRALERATPKAIGDASKMLRYLREGVTSRRGDVVLPRGELNEYELFLQGLGFVPTDVALKYDQNRITFTRAEQIESRRTQLMNRLALAVQNDDNSAWDEAMDDIKKYNAANPSRAIGAEGIITSVKSRARYSAESVNGIRVEPGLRYLHDELRFTDDSEEGEE